MSFINYSESFKQFLKNSDCKVANILHKINQKYETNHNFTSGLITDSKIDYVTFRTDGSISYLPKAKKHKVNDNGDWSREGRQNGAASKVIRKLFTKKGLTLLKDTDFECFSNNYKYNFNEEGYKFELLPNKEIKNIYDEELICVTGTLGGSCMNKETDYLDMYEACEDLQILVLRNKEENLCGRALLWTIEDIKFLDRFYVFQDFQYEMFLKYVEDNNLWRRKYYKTYDNKTTFINPEGEEVEKYLMIKLNTDFDEFPYIDTFTYGGNGYITNNDAEDLYNYCQTDGNRDYNNDEDTRWDEINNIYIDEEEAVYIDKGERRGSVTHQDNTVLIGSYYWYIDDQDIIEINNKWYEKSDDDIIYVNDEWVMLDDCVIDEDTQRYILETDTVKINDKYYRTDSDNIVEINGDYYLTDSEDIVMSEDGEYELA